MRLLFLASNNLALAILVTAVELLAQTVIALKAGAWKVASQHLANGVCLTHEKAVQRLVAKSARVCGTSAIRTDEVIIVAQLVNNLFLCWLRSKLETNFVRYLTFVLFWNNLGSAFVKFHISHEWLGFSLALLVTSSKALEKSHLVLNIKVDRLELVAYLAHTCGLLNVYEAFQLHVLVQR